MVITVGNYITEAHIRGLPFLRDPSVYIHSRGAIEFVVVGNGLGRGCVFVLDGVFRGLSQWLVVV